MTREDAVKRDIATRRQIIASLAVSIAGLALGTGRAAAGGAALDFGDLYSKISVLGLTFSDKVKALAGREVAMRGFMAPPLKAEAKFFVLTEIPMALCPFCSTDADWPDNIVVVYLSRTQTFEQPNALIEATGTLEVGSWTDPETGFLSRLRIVGASYARV